MAKAGRSGGAGTESVLPGGGNIDQIREILFGAAQREQEGRASNLERLIERTNASQAERLEKAKANLEGQIEKMTSELSSRLDQIVQRLEQAESNARQMNADTTKSLTDKLSKLDGSLSKALETQGDAFDRKRDSLPGELTAAISKLDEDKTGRLDLGDQLIEIGMRLKGDETLGAIESSLSGLLGANSDEKA